MEKTLQPKPWRRKALEEKNLGGNTSEEKKKERFWLKKTLDERNLGGGNFRGGNLGGENPGGENLGGNIVRVVSSKVCTNGVSNLKSAI